MRLAILRSKLSPRALSIVRRFFLLTLIVFIARQADAQFAAHEERSCVFVEEEHESDQVYFDRPSFTGGAKQTQPLPLTPIQTGSDDFPNVNVTHDFLFPQDETSVTIDPTNPENVYIGMNGFQSANSLVGYRSSDGGRTFTEGVLPEFTLWSEATDPAVTYDHAGRLFFSYGRSLKNGEHFPPNDVVCYRSSNKGASWEMSKVYDPSTSHPAKVFTDKFHIASDNAAQSPNRGNLYVAWVEQLDSTTGIVLSRSTDHGVTWSQQVQLTPQWTQYQSPIPACGPAGEVYVTFIDRSFTSRRILVARSLDGGKTFDPPQTISTYNELGPMRPPTIDGFPVIKDTIGVNSFPSVAVSTSGASTGRAFITWAASDDTGRHHIYFSLSSDQGAHWSQPRAIEDDPSPVRTDKFFPWVAVDQTNGDVGVAFYDSRMDPLDTLVDLFMAHSNDGGEHFTVRRVSTTSCDPRISNLFRSIDSFTILFFGDYIGMAAHNRVWYPAWTDTRNGQEQDVFTAHVMPYRPAAVHDLVAFDDGSGHARIEWKYEGESVFGYPLGDYRTVLTRNEGGTEVSIPASGRFHVDETVQPAVLYRYALRVISGTDTSALRSVSFEVGQSSVFEEGPPSNFALVSPSYPNPVQIGRTSSIMVRASKQLRGHLRVLNSAGQVVSDELIRVASGEQILSIRPPSAGVFFYELDLGGQRSRGKIVVLPRE